MSSQFDGSSCDVEVSSTVMLGEWYVQGQVCALGQKCVSDLLGYGGSPSLVTFYANSVATAAAMQDIRDRELELVQLATTADEIAAYRVSTAFRTRDIIV